MGRRKISITKLEAEGHRRNTFTKRSLGIKKKVKEISVLSDGKVMLLIRSPKGEYDVALGVNNTFDDIVQQFLSESQENRNKSWNRSMKELDKAFREDEESYKALRDHGMLSTKKEGSHMEEFKSVKDKISEIESRLGPLRNINDIDKINSIDEIAATRKLILELLVKNEQEKELFMVKQRSGVHNFTIPHIRDIRCSRRAPDSTDHTQVTWMPNFTSPYQGVNSRYSASMGIPVRRYPSNSGNQQQEHTYINERDVQEQTWLAKWIAGEPCGFNEGDVINQMRELEEAILEDPTGLSDFRSA
ncbi:MADS-box transcription factor family protein [Rhynchospora pubera]|uniref:MADS-box transcription factor family protein n=1 Tax=Rhynchospora pubera TaxID=906938 RepID=A0AAV8EL88_9POAL|nr:MADS-box transcription factor family protein [Rhynchospora pubera]